MNFMKLNRESHASEPTMHPFVSLPGAALALACFTAQAQPAFPSVLAGHVLLPAASV
ncbi:MAG: hypothetical protein WA210_04185 [Burkholderiaceae bacterium]